MFHHQQICYSTLHGAEPGKSLSFVFNFKNCTVNIQNNLWSNISRWTVFGLFCLFILFLLIVSFVAITSCVAVLLSFTVCNNINKIKLQVLLNV